MVLSSCLLFVQVLVTIGNNNNFNAISEKKEAREERKKERRRGTERAVQLCPLSHVNLIKVELLLLCDWLFSTVRMELSWNFACRFACRPTDLFLSLFLSPSLPGVSFSLSLSFQVNATVRFMLLLLSIVRLLPSSKLLLPM